MRTITPVLTSIWMLAAAPMVRAETPAEEATTAPPTTVAPQVDSQPPLAGEARVDSQPPATDPVRADRAPAQPAVSAAKHARGVEFAEVGAHEAGGSVGIAMATAIHDVNVTPHIGWFIADHLELSALFGVSYDRVDGQSSTVWSAVVEPAYHVPITPAVFGFFGMGIGAGYEPPLGTGLEVAPRLGAKFLVGSGIVTPAVSYEYITHGAMTHDNVTAIAVTTALRVNVGYAVFW